MSPKLKPDLTNILLGVIFFTVPADLVLSKDIPIKENIRYSNTSGPCPPATLYIHAPVWVCEESDPFQLNLTSVGLFGEKQITWSGQAITSPDGWFDPHLGTPIGTNWVYVTVVQGTCTYTDSINIGIIMKDIPSFYLEGAPCKDSTIHLIFNGMGYGTSDWYYEFDGAEFKQVEWPDDYDLKWHEPGNYTLSLWMDRHGCYSDTFVLPVIIGQYLEAPKVICNKEDFYLLEITWLPVQGANAYLISTSFGTDTVPGTVYSLEHLPDNFAVDFQVTALQPGGCGPSETSTIQCTTLKYIEPSIYIPNIFSPNNDGINDLLIVQANTPVTLVNNFNIFDRWGNLVFADDHFPPNDPAYGWDGLTTNDAPNPQVYVYRAELQTVYGDQIHLTGDITLVK